MLPSSDSLPVKERKKICVPVEEKNMCSRRGNKKNNAKISHQRNFDPLKLSLIAKLANFWLKSNQKFGHVNRMTFGVIKTQTFILQEWVGKSSNQLENENTKQGLSHSNAARRRETTFRSLEKENGLQEVITYR
jgi:hypothetical protein